MNVLMSKVGLRVRFFRTPHFTVALPTVLRSYSNSPTYDKKNDDKDMSLRSDVRMLGSTLGSIIQSSSPEVFNAVERLRAHGREWRQGDGNPAEFKVMVDEIASYDVPMLRNIARAFTHFLSLANTAENHHRIRHKRHRHLDQEYESLECGSVDCC